VRLPFTHPLYFALPSCFFPFFAFALPLNNHLLLHIIILLQVEKASRFVRLSSKSDFASEASIFKDCVDSVSIENM
jgi:hypothetical protein